MDWRVAKSLNVLLNQLNVMFPGRDKSSDGSIGDAAHATRDSNHNPWVHDSNGQPVVTARDFTNDPKHMDSHLLALALVASRDQRIKYVIDHGKICAGNLGPQPWVWRKYNGINQHDHHCHLSVIDQQGRYDDETQWVIKMPEASAEDLSAKQATPPAKTYITLRKGSTGAEVGRLQQLLNKHGYSKVVVDDAFGKQTRVAVVAFQNANKLVGDGVVGKYTWLALET